MSAPNEPSRRGDTGSEFFLFLQSLRNRFVPGEDGTDPFDDELLEFALDDDDDDFRELATAVPAPTAGAATVATAAAAAAEDDPALDLPLELAPPLPRWSRLLGELTAGFGAIAAVEVWLGHGLGSFGVHPHPYWLLVLPIAATRGLVGGLAAATVATVLFCVGASATPQIANWLDLLTYEHGLELLGFFLAAFLVGDARDRADVRTHALWRSLMHGATERARILAKARLLQATNHDLKVRLLDHSAQFGHLLDAARRLETAGRRELLDVAIDMVAEHCRADRASAIEFHGQAPHVLAMKGWGTGEVDLLLQQASMAESVQRAWQHGDRYDAFAADQVPSQHGPLLIAPVLRDDGTIDTLLCLDAIQPDNFNHGVASIFFGIAEWVQIGLQRLARGDRFAATPDAHETVASGWVGDRAELATRLQVEQVRMSRLRVRTSLIAIHATVAAGSRARNQERFEQLLEATMLNGLLRSSDTLYRTAHPGTWLIVLPATPDESAQVVQGRIQSFLGAMKFGRLQAFALATFAPKQPAAPLSSVVAEIAAWVGQQTGTEVDLGIDERPPAHQLDDAVGLAKRLGVEAHLSRRWVSDLYAVHLQLDAVRIERPDQLPTAIEELATRFLDVAASVHEIEPGSYAMLLPFTNCHAAFHLGREMARGLGNRFASAGTPNLPVEFSVYALAGRADEGHFLLDRLLHREVEHAVEPAPVEVAS